MIFSPRTHSNTPGNGCSSGPKHKKLRIKYIFGAIKAMVEIGFLWYRFGVSRTPRSLIASLFGSKPNITVFHIHMNPLNFFP